MPTIAHGLSRANRFAADMFDARMLFSALVDADFVATEGHFTGNAKTPYRPREEGPTLDLDRALAALASYHAAIRRTHGNDPMAGPREALLADCLGAAAEDRGLFTLSAPTGAGKTLAMLAFALHHAKRHNLRRIVLVMPFLNIIDQTAQTYRSIFTSDNGFAPNVVLEQHSLADAKMREREDADEDAENIERLLAQNWDAPIILTTTVQLFESLMSNRSSRCRKLHRLARSVILFDEAQTLSTKLALATLANLARLAEAGEPYGSTVVFATATQPAFDAFDERLRNELHAQGWQPTKIVRHTGRLYKTAAKRVRVTWRHQSTVDLDELAGELATHDRVLCIVNLKRHAVHLAKALQKQKVDGLLHLSTNMCPAHRAAVLADVRRRLAERLPIRLISTQCVEAGVDLDFPVVYRALAPLEAIAQAAGRCNRHGNGPTGRVIVFKPHDDRSLYPPGYGEAVDSTETFLNGLTAKGDLNSLDIINDPVRLRKYFRHFYGLTGRASAKLEDERPLLEAIGGGDFAEVAKLYKLIQQDAVNVLVPYDRAIFDQLRVEITEAPRLTPELIRSWIARASAHAISLYRPRDGASITPHLEPIQFSRRHAVEAWEADWFIALPGVEYDRLTGISENTDNLWIV